MIVDSSAILAILFDEEDGAGFAEAIASADERLISPVNFVEAATRYGARNGSPTVFDAFIQAARIEIEAVTVEQAHLARMAYARFGRGTGHPARLNLGDCFAYALARSRADVLLFKGDDFIHTDVRRAI